MSNKEHNCMRNGEGTTRGGAPYLLYIRDRRSGGEKNERWRMIVLFHDSSLLQGSDENVGVEKRRLRRSGFRIEREKRHREKVARRKAGQERGDFRRKTALKVPKNESAR